MYALRVPCAVAALLVGCWMASEDVSGKVGSLSVAQAPPKAWVRAGYSLSVAVESLENARFLALGGNGTLYVSQPNLSRISACRDDDGDGIHESIVPFVQDRPSVHAMQWHEGWLWFAYAGTIARARDTDGDHVADEEERILGPDVLVPGGGHWWRSLLVHDGRIYTSIGDSGNIEDESETKRQKIWSYAFDGTDERLFCSGLRNTEKLVVRPGTDEIWGMDHGSDWFGGVLERQGQSGSQPITDLNPPCEMNHYVEGGFYGHPFITGRKLPRYEYMDRPDIVELAELTIPPEWSTGAHWAPNAMCFYAGAQFPDAYGDAFVAYHGSWNRTQPGGYAVSRVHFEDGHPWGEQIYVRFLTDGGEVLGRPVDVAVEADGSLLISDDWGNRVYRLRYVGDGASASGPAPSADEPADQRDVSLAPIDTYSRFCTRCHGPEGQHLLAGEGQFRHSDEAELRAITADMMLGTAGLAASASEVDAMTGYMLAIQSDRPFGTITNGPSFLAGATKVLRGDVRPGSRVIVAVGDQALEAAVDGHWWSAEVPAEPRFHVVLTRGDAEAVIEFPEATWPPH